MVTVREISWLTFPTLSMAFALTVWVPAVSIIGVVKSMEAPSSTVYRTLARPLSSSFAAILMEEEPGRNLVPVFNERNGVHHKFHFRGVQVQEE